MPDTLIMGGGKVNLVHASKGGKTSKIDTAGAGIPFTLTMEEEKGQLDTHKEEDKTSRIYTRQSGAGIP